MQTQSWSPPPPSPTSGKDLAQLAMQSKPAKRNTGLAVLWLPAVAPPVRAVWPLADSRPLSGLCRVRHCTCTQLSFPNRSKNPIWLSACRRLPTPRYNFIASSGNSYAASRAAQPTSAPCAAATARPNAGREPATSFTHPRQAPSLALMQLLACVED